MCGTVRKVRPRLRHKQRFCIYVDSRVAVRQCKQKDDQLLCCARSHQARQHVVLTQQGGECSVSLSVPLSRNLPPTPLPTPIGGPVENWLSLTNALVEHVNAHACNSHACDTPPQHPNGGGHPTPPHPTPPHPTPPHPCPYLFPSAHTHACMQARARRARRTRSPTRARAHATACTTPAPWVAQNPRPTIPSIPSDGHDPWRYDHTRMVTASLHVRTQLQSVAQYCVPPRLHRATD